MAFSFASPVLAAELHVDDDAASGGDGSIASPFTTVQAAIDAAADGDDILVAGGMYAAIEVAAKEVHLFGGYDAAFTTIGADTPSIVEGTAAAPAVTLFESGASILDGFVVRGGQRGVFIDADYMSTTNEPVVRNNIIEQNGTTTLIGGGVFADHCEASIIGNTVRANMGDRGSGIATLCTTLLVEDNVIEDNVSSGDHGGGLYISGTTLTVRGNVLRNNEVGVIAGYGWGAGVTVYGAGVTANFERNVFTQNHAMSLGSGAFVDDGAIARFDRDLFFANECGTEGGAGLFVDGYDVDVASEVTLTNVTIAGHDCPGMAGNAVAVQAQSTVEIVNGIMWANAGDDFAVDATSSITATYTLSEEAIDGQGNLSGDPLFVDPAAGDYHVRSTKGRFDPSSGEFVIDDVDSPTIDVGDPASDFAMEPGPNGLRVNLGHTGNTPEASMGGPGGDPPGDESGGDSDGGSSADESGGEADDATGAGGSDGADDGADESGSEDTAAEEDDDMTIGCACSSMGDRAPWHAALVVVVCVAMRRRRIGHDRRGDHISIT
jgi:hypothetical protein